MLLLVTWVWICSGVQHISSDQDFPKWGTAEKFMNTTIIIELYKKYVDNVGTPLYNSDSHYKGGAKNGGIAQVARAYGSYP